MTMMGEAGESPLEGAVQRLDRALAKLEARVTTLASEAESHNGGLFDQDRAKLGAELDAALDRERALRDAGVEASDALGRAIAEIRVALAEPEERPDDVVDSKEA